MAISETLCWEVLGMAHGETVSSKWLKGKHSDDPPIENAIPLFEIERDLVLRHSKNEIEDSLYFLEKRGYLIRHGFQGLTRVAFELSGSALEVIESGSFSDNEQEAFREALVDASKPGWFGIKLNLGEAMRRLKKSRN